MRKSLKVRVLSILLTCSIAGCGWKVIPPVLPEQPISPHSVAERVVLTVNDRAVVWGGGQLGQIVADVLLSKGTFKEIEYPVESRNPPDLRLVINANGRVNEEVGPGIVKGIIIGCLLFLPVGLIRFDKTFELDTEVVLLKAGKKLRQFNIKSKTGISHTLFSAVEEYEAAARQAAFKDLGERIAAELDMVRLD